MKISSKLRDIAAVAADEFRTVSTSYSVLLVLMGGIFLYGLLYNYMYEPNLIRDAPVAVVDRSHSPLSREYARLLDAAPQVRVLTDEAGFPEAKELMKRGDAVGIVYIPEDFETRVGRGEESLFVMYGTTEAFLYYLAMQEAASGAMLELDGRYRPQMLVFLPRRDVQPITQTPAVTVVGTALYNHTEGYGSYLIPAVLMVIIFQTLLMVIGMTSGEERDSGSIRRYAAGGVSLGRMARVIAGKTFVYGLLYALFSVFLLGLMPAAFNLPELGSGYLIAMLMIPYLLATCFFALAVSVFFTDSEAPLLMIAFFSVGLIFLSGVSYPLELMPWYWRAAHYVFPAGDAGLRQGQLDGRLDGRHPRRVRDAVGSVRRLFRAGLHGLSVQCHPRAAPRAGRCRSAAREDFYLSAMAESVLPPGRIARNAILILCRRWCHASRNRRSNTPLS